MSPSEDALEAAAAGRFATARSLLADLVAQPSISGSAACEACLDLVADALAGVAGEVLRPVRDGHGSLVMRFGAGPAAHRLAFSGHVDVVPAEGAWTVPPFALTESDGALIGRGSCDMKGGVAAFAAAVLSLADAGLLDGCALELVLTGDEEVGGGAETIPGLVAEAVTARRAICGEPTGLDVFLGNRGLLWVDFTVRGRGGHAGQLHHLDDPVPVALDLARGLLELSLAGRDERFDPPVATLAVTRIAAGDSAAPNVVPDEVTVGIDRRLMPGEDVDGALAEMCAVLAGTVVPPFRHETALRSRWPAYAISLDDELPTLATAVVRACGRPGATGMDSAANDSSWLHAQGIETILLGPGRPSQAHVSDESLGVDELDDAVRIYTRLAATTDARAADA